MFCGNTRAQLSSLAHLKVEYGILAHSLREGKISVDEYQEKVTKLNDDLLGVHFFLNIHKREQLQLGAALRDKLNIKSVGEFYDGCAIARDVYGKSFHIDRFGKPLYSQRFASVGNFYNGLSFVFCGPGLRLLKKDGTFLNDTIYQMAGEFHEGVAWVRERSGRYYYIKSDGSRLNDEEYQDISDCSGGSIYVLHNGKRKRVIVHENQNNYEISLDSLVVKDPLTEKYTLKRFDGKLLTTEEYDEASEFIDGVSVVKKDEVYFLVDENGKRLTHDGYRKIERTASGLFFVHKDDEKYFIDVHGERLFGDNLYDFNSEDECGLRVVKYQDVQRSDGENVIIDVNGNVVWWW